MKTKTADTSPILTDAGRSLRAGDRVNPSASFQALFDRHAPELLAFLAARLGRAEADEVRKETWLRIRTALGESGKFDGKNFRAWAFQIARSVITDRQPHELDHGHAIPIDSDHITAESDPFAERREALSGCLEVLSKEERIVFQARCEGMKAATLAERAKVTPERIYALLERAKAKITEHAKGAV